MNCVLKVGLQKTATAVDDVVVTAFTKRRSQGILGIKT
jgi:hypothetical protein